VLNASILHFPGDIHSWRFNS